MSSYGFGSEQTKRRKNWIDCAESKIPPSELPLYILTLFVLTVNTSVKAVVFIKMRQILSS